MKIVLATGIFPPDIGGPATYVREVARELAARGEEVIVITYGKKAYVDQTEKYSVVNVGNFGGPLGRWLRYRDALRTHAADADILMAFTSVSAGIPMMMSKLRTPQKILRLGGDFFWERFTDRGGTLGLREWYISRFGLWRMLNTFFMGRILRSFDQLVYSTRFQQELHQKAYNNLPPSTVVENARPASISVEHVSHTPFKLLFMGRFVRFKNIPALIDAVAKLPDVTLSIVGAGPTEQELKNRVKRLGLESRIQFHAPVSGDQKKNIVDSHDLLVLPSLTEISPNVALEVRSMGMPVLLTEETGLSAIPDVYTRPLRTLDEIATAIREIKQAYRSPKMDVPVRTYENVADALFPRTHS